MTLNLKYYDDCVLLLITLSSKYKGVTLGLIILKKTKLGEFLVKKMFSVKIRIATASVNLCEYEHLLTQYR